MSSAAAKADAVREEYEEACNKVEAIKVCSLGQIMPVAEYKKNAD